MTAVIIIFASVCVLIALSVLFLPQLKLFGVTFSPYWLIALVGAVVLVAVGYVSPREVLQAFSADTSVNPIKILTLFISMSLISVFLDDAGFFAYVAAVAVRRAGGSGVKLFFRIYLTVSVLTVFTSNDIVVLTFTPFICYFAKHTNINPLPYLVAEFTAANTWSMLFLIGNPTNIYLSTAANVGFGEYFAVMWLPTLCGGAASLAMLFLLFGKHIKRPFEANSECVRLKDKPLAVIGLIHLVLCTLMLVFSQYIAVEMWLISLGFALSLAVVSSIYYLISRRRPSALFGAAKHAPWQLIPFVLSMFVFVLALETHGAPEALNNVLSASNPIVGYGGTSFIAANLINNIPMSVLFSPSLNALNGARFTGALYATVISSNLGALLTPLGSLAGIMWLGILKKQGVKFSFAKFCAYGSAVSLPTLASALGGLALIL